jgi:PncC family amidohydrolase
MIEEQIIERMRSLGWHLTTAESCTGGMIASRLVGVSGASYVLDQGLVTYTNQAKIKYLGVDENTLEQYTAVSKEVAMQMAVGGNQKTKSDVCISVTGYAGPEPAEDGTPAGRVYIGCCVHEKVVVKKCDFTGSRNEVREQAAQVALELLWQMISTN